MPQSPMRFIKSSVDQIEATRIGELPSGLRGIYVLYKEGSPENGRTKRFDVAYVGLAGIADKASIRRRLEEHRSKKKEHWSHFSAFVVHDNVSPHEIQELEGLFRHIYRHDANANPLNRQRRYKKLKEIEVSGPKDLR